MDESICQLRGVWFNLFSIIYDLFDGGKSKLSYANSVEPDRTPRVAASDLGLHYLLMSHLYDIRHVNVGRQTNFG